jgi:hypothetical protein
MSKNQNKPHLNAFLMSVGHHEAKVVPILRERGRFRTEYEGRTLRDRYGLPRPANRLDDVAMEVSA